MTEEEELKAGDMVVILHASIGAGHTCPVVEARENIVLVDLSDTSFGGRAWYFRKELQKAPQEVA